MMAKEQSFSEKCIIYLNDRWDYINQIAETDVDEPLSEDYASLKKLINQCLTSKTKTYRYVLPTQLLSKSVNDNYNSHSLQASWNRKGSFDARSVAHAAIVPFDKENHKVLGGSPEPYVNNPLRCPAVTKDNRDRQKNQDDWDKLIEILDLVEEEDNIEFTKSLFDQVLYEIFKLLAEVKITYPTPNRVSLENTFLLIKEYISIKSGGQRLEAIATALFQIIGEKFSLFDEVEREKVNTADASSGMVADIECSINGETVLLVEVKDRDLSLTQLDSKLDKARSRRISEILFLAEKGLRQDSEEKIKERIKSEFTSGQNVYVMSLLEFCHGILVLLGETGRVEFLSKIGPELDRVNAPIKHRRAWAKLLKDI